MNRSNHRRSPPRLLTFLLWLGLFLLAHSPVAAPLDLILLLDASASVARHDPHDQRRHLARALIDHLDRRDRAAVIAFADEIYPLTPLLPLNGRGHRARLREALTQVPEDGFYTDLPGALDEAALRLSGTPERAKAIVLISDGRIELADSDNTARHTQYLLFDLLPRLRKRKIRLFTVAPPQGANTSLLQLLAEDGRGLYLPLEAGRSADVLARRILALAHRGGIPPRQRHQIEIATGTQIAIVSARPKGDPQLRVLAPDDKPRTLPQERQGGRIYLRLDRPDPGTWTLDFRKGRLEGIQLFQDPTANLRLQSGEPLVGSQLVFNAWIQERNGAPPELKKLPLRLTITQPDGSTTELPLDDQGRLGDAIAGDGIYTTVFVPTQPGSYALDLESHLGPYPLTSHHSLEISEPPPEPPPAAPIPPEHGDAEVGHPETNHSPATEHHGNEEPPPPPGEKDGLGLIFWLSLLWFVLVLAGAGAGVWWWLKKKKGGSKKTASEDDGAVEIDDE